MSHAPNLRAIYDAINAGDEIVLAARLSADFAFEQRTESTQMPWFTLYDGLDATLEALRATSEGRLTLNPTTLIDGGERITAHVDVTWQPKAAEGKISAPLSWREVHQWRFDDLGRATRLRCHSETRAAPAGTAMVLPFLRPHEFDRTS